MHYLAPHHKLEYCFSERELLKASYTVCCGPGELLHQLQDAGPTLIATTPDLLPKVQNLQEKYDGFKVVFLCTNALD